MSYPLNVATRLSKMAQAMPDAVAVVEPLGYDNQGKRQYRQFTFRQLDCDSDCIAQGLRRMGVVPGTRLALLVRPGIDFVSLVFALLKAGAVSILIDPGMGRRNLVRCLAEAQPEGFIAIPQVHAVRVFLRRRFPQAKFNVTVGRRWFWGGPTLRQVRRAGLSDAARSAGDIAPTNADDPAAIIFTTGSTGPPKGALFTHGNFEAQVDQIRDRFQIRPGEIDLPAFPLFGLFNCAMGVTAVIPDMDPSRPARVDPAKIIEAVRDWNVTQTFGSPAIWDRVGRYCREHEIRLTTVRRVLSSGAPVPVEVLRRMKDCIHQQGDMYTPYGATEALPVASIAASEVLGETAEKTRQGAGTCVGRKFPLIEWKVIRIVDGPIASINDIEELPMGEIGELIVSGPQVSKCYVTRLEANAMAKIVDITSFSPGTHAGREISSFSREPTASAHGINIWHRMGDAGYFDREGRFWFCGRVAHRVLSADGPLYPIRCEAIFNRHPDIFRSALVGVGPDGRQRPVVILEPKQGKFPKTATAKKALLDEIRRLGQSSPLTQSIGDFLIHPSFPVDIRHNAKIFREKLAVWAAKKLNAY
ncbi:MAG: fatty acid CoA ligase family protein [Thermoguttaceae bacterium]|jgi:acyl-CoA synthetase (AMP-forming)/AMP-acid ligase II